MGYSYGYGFGHTWRGKRRNIGALSGNGASMLAGETDGFATNFTWPIDAERVAVKSAGVALSQKLDEFYLNSGTSPKMVYDVAGTLGWSPHNYSRQSQGFNSIWALENVTVVADTVVAPDGTMTADKLVENSATGSHDVQMGGSTAVNGMMAVYAKAAGRSRILLYDSTGFGYGFDLTTGTTFVVSGITPSSTVTIQDAGNGWWRCIIPSVAALGPSVYIVTGTIYSYAGDGASGVYLWGAQLNRGPVLLAYLPTTTAARFGLALDYDPVTHASKGLFIEQAATNLCLQSAGGRIGQEFTGNGSTRTGGQPDPSGGNEALLVVVTSNSAGINAVRSVTQVNATQYTASMWCKGTAGQQIYFDGASTVTASQVLVTFTGAWQRVSSTYTSASTSDFMGFECYNRGGGAHLPAVTFQCWGGQLETGTLPTSYIPTIAASATRAGDNYYFPLVIIPPLGTTYSMYCRFAVPLANNVRFAFVLTDGTTAEYVGYRSSTGILLQIIDNGVSQGALAQGTMPANTFLSAASRIKASDFASSVDGLTAQTSATGTLPTVTEARLSGRDGSNGQALQSFNIAKVAVITSRGWRNSELKDKSAS